MQSKYEKFMVFNLFEDERMKNVKGIRIQHIMILIEYLLKFHSYPVLTSKHKVNTQHKHQDYYEYF